MSTALMRNKILRRALGATLLVGGALLLWLTPETLSGVLVAAAGIALELAGIAIDHG